MPAKFIQKKSHLNKDIKFSLLLHEKTTIIYKFNKWEAIKVALTCPKIWKNVINHMSYKVITLFLFITSNTQCVVIQTQIYDFPKRIPVLYINPLLHSI